MKTLIVNNNTKHIEAWEDLAKLSALDATVISYASLDPAIASQYDLTILTGGSNLVPPFEEVAHLNPSWRDRFSQPLAKEIELVNISNKPILGVCLGFEVIADTFGATLVRDNEQVCGFSYVHVTKSNQIFGDLENFNAKEAHKYSLPEVPSILEEFARSETGVEVFKHRERPIYGFQFHPEVISKENSGTQVFVNLVNFLRRG